VVERRLDKGTGGGSKRGQKKTNPEELGQGRTGQKSEGSGEIGREGL